MRVKSINCTDFKKKKKKLFGEQWRNASTVHWTVEHGFFILTRRKQLLAAFFFLAFQTQLDMGPIYSNKRLLINQTACKIWPENMDATT